MINKKNKGTNEKGVLYYYMNPSHQLPLFFKMMKFGRTLKTLIRIFPTLPPMPPQPPFPPALGCAPFLPCTL